jgi:hypothetical protein
MCAGYEKGQEVGEEEKQKEWLGPEPQCQPLLLSHFLNVSLLGYHCVCEYRCPALLSVSTGWENLPGSSF